MSARLRRRLVIAGVAAALVAITGTVALVRSRPPSCDLAAPVPDLPARLQALGDFDRPYDVGDERNLEEVAARAASALHPNLIGTVADHSVAVAAPSAERHDARIVPLLSPSADGRPRVVGALVSFLLDCSGRAYYSAVEDVSAQQPRLAGFPVPARDEAARTLGAEPRLTYRHDPLHPTWLNPRTGAETPAR